MLALPSDGANTKTPEGCDMCILGMMGDLVIYIMDKGLKPNQRACSTNIKLANLPCRGRNHGCHSEMASGRAPRTSCLIAAGSYVRFVHHGGVAKASSPSRYIRDHFRTDSCKVINSVNPHKKECVNIKVYLNMT